MPITECPHCHNEFDALTQRKRYCSTQCSLAAAEARDPGHKARALKRWRTQQKIKAANKPLPLCLRCRRPFWAATRRQKYCRNADCMTAHRNEMRRKWDAVTRARKRVAKANEKPMAPMPSWNDFQNAPEGKSEAILQRILDLGARG